MAKKIRSVLAIDIGGASLKMAEFSFPQDGAVTLNSFAFCDFEDRDADIGTAFAEAYRKLLADNKFTAQDVCLTISGQSSFSRLAKLPQLSGNSAAISKIIAFEAQQIVPYPMDEIVWGYQLISHVEKIERVIEPEDPNAEGAEPRTEIEENEEFEALFVAVKNDQITIFTDVILESGKRIASVDIAPVAMFNAAKATQCAGDESSLLLNIGGRSTSLVIADGNRIFVRSIPIAGDTVTQQISKEFSVSFAEAEELKRRHGFVALGGAYEEPESEVAATISKIARNVMTRLHGEINRSISVWRSHHKGNPPTKVYLAGGGALMFYTQEFFHEKLRLPVDFLNVFSAVSLSPDIDRQKLLDVAPMFSELVGVSMHCVSECPVDISLIPSSIQFQMAFKRKGLFFYISMALVLVCLTLFLFAVSYRTSYSRQLVEGTKGNVTATQATQGKIRKLMGEYNSAKSDYAEASAFLEQRGEWVKMLTELQQILPDNLWITALDGRGDMLVKQETKDPGMGGFTGFEFAGPAGGRGGRGGRGGAAPEVAKPKVPDKIDAAKVTLVKELRLKFYTLIFDNDLLEDEFRNALRKSKYFVDTDDGFVIEAYEGGKGVDNLKAFTVTIKLKNPIKK